MMYRVRRRITNSDYLNFENLLRNYTLNPNDENLKQEILKVIKSAVAFQKGQFVTNDYIDSSEAYNLLLTAINLDISRFNKLENDLQSNKSNNSMIQIAEILLDNVSNLEYGDNELNVLNSNIAWY